MTKLRDSKMFWKVFLALLLVGFLASIAIGAMGLSIGVRTIREESFNKLTAIREAKALHVEDEMRTIRSQAGILAEDYMVLQAMKEFRRAFTDLEKEAATNPGEVAAAWPDLKQFYEHKFLPRLNDHATTIYYSEEFKPTNPATILLQDRYIAANPNPVGEKYLLMRSPADSEYDRVHARFQPIFQDIQKKLHYHDIHLVDLETGAIVYSVSKEVDFGKSILDPILRPTNFARAFQASAATTAGKDFQRLEDFQPFFAAYNAPAAFISAPIFDQGKKIGVLVLELPIDRINDIMTNHQRWQEAGLGVTGETYLIGADETLRSQSRFFLADREGYLEAMRNRKRLKPETIREISALGTTIGLQPVRTPGARRALAGETGETSFKDYRGVEVLSSFRPLHIPDVRWAILSEIDRGEAYAPVKRLATLMAGGFGLLLLAIALFSRTVSRLIADPLAALAELMEEVERTGDLSLRARDSRRDEIGRTIANFHSLLGRWATTLMQSCENTETIVASDHEAIIDPVVPLTDQDVLGMALNDMTTVLQRYHRETVAKRWLDEGKSLLNERMRGEQEPKELANKVLEFLARYCNVQMGLFYLGHVDGSASVVASYALPSNGRTVTDVEPGDGLVGQVLVEQKAILLENVSEEYTPIQSGLGEERPRHLLLTPLVANGQVEGVIELATLHRFSAGQKEFLDQVAESIAIAVASAKSRIRNRELLEYTQEQAEKLQNQSEELRNQTEELQNQTAELEAQQEQLRLTNSELSERGRMLEEQRNEITEHNTRLEEARKLLEVKATELEKTNRYKSEFLANMSHELRTPMNSILVLSQSLLEGATDRLSPKQQEYLKTIHDSGQGLLGLINDILDVSKMEAGRMTLAREEVIPAEVAESLGKMFTPLAAQKGLKLEIEVAEKTPALATDRQRLEQILRNFLGNAIKFTGKGVVKLRIHPARRETAIGHHKYPASALIAFAVQDTGIGIAEDKRQIIFEAFRQEDGSTSRIYGGTGLGLAISTEFAKLMGGMIELESEQGRGSTFTLLLPVVAPEPSAAKTAAEPAEPGAATPPDAIPPEPMADPPPVDAPTEKQRPELTDKTILVVDDDMRNIYSMAAILEPHGIEMEVANNGRDALEMLRANCRINAVIMDIMMPKMDGYETTRQIRAIKELRDVPIIVLTAKVMKDERERCLAAGANEYLTKPVDRDRLLGVLQVWLYEVRNRCTIN